MPSGTRADRFKPKPEAVDFGRRVVALRHARRLSARWVADEAGMTSAYIRFLELGRCVPSAAKLAALAEVFGVTMDELWNGVGRCADLLATTPEDRP